MAAQVTFTISNGWTVTSMVELNIAAMMVPGQHTISGMFKDVVATSFNGGLQFGNVNNFTSITIYGANPIQGSLAQVQQVMQQVSLAAANGTGRAMILNNGNVRSLTIS